MRAAYAGLVLAAAGCVPFQAARSPANWFGANAGAPANKVVLQTVLIDRPAGDPYLTAGLWTAAGRAIAPDKAALLAENGIRVGVVNGNPPPDFLRLVTSEEATLRPMQSTCAAGEPKTVPVNGPDPRAVFRAVAEIGTKPAEYDLPAAECGLILTATPGEPGMLKLTVEPRVQHGAKQGWLTPAADGTGFAWLDGKPSERFGKLTFDVPVGAKDYIVIGPTSTPVGTVGGAFFLSAADGRSRMRVLVVRAWRGPEPASDGVPGRKPTAAVAAQAGKPLARGQVR